jgi:hypothetical protein
MLYTKTCIVYLFLIPYQKNEEGSLTVYFLGENENFEIGEHKIALNEIYKKMILSKI